MNAFWHGFADRVAGDPALFAHLRQKTAFVDDRPLVTSGEDLLPTTARSMRQPKRKLAMVPRQDAHVGEQMTPAKWKQTLKDVPIAMLAGGVGYGIGRTLAEAIGKGVADTGSKPGWLKAVPYAAGAISGVGTYAGMRVRETLKERREAAE